MYSVHIVRSNPAVYGHIKELGESHYRFFVNPPTLEVELRLILGVLILAGRFGKKEQKCICC